MIILMFIGVLMGCRNSSRNKEPVRKVTLALTSQTEATLVHLAMAKGYFTQEGIRMQPLMHATGRAALASMLAGRADLATAADTPVVFAVLTGEKPVIVASIFSSNKNNGVIAGRDRGVVVPHDLKGKVVGYTPGTSSEFYMDSFLTANAILRGDMKLVALKPEEMQNALISGKIDAAVTWNYYLANIRKRLGSRGVTFIDKQIYTEIFNLVAGREYVQKNPMVIRQVVRALLKAEKFAAEHPDEAQAFVATELRIDKSLIAELWSEFNFRVSLDQLLLLVLEDESRWAMNGHPVEGAKMPNYLNYIHVDSLRGVKPEAVTLISR